MVNKDEKTETSFVIWFFDSVLVIAQKLCDIIYDIVQKYENVEVFQLQKLGRLSIKIMKA